MRASRKRQSRSREMAERSIKYTHKSRQGEMASLLAFHKQGKQQLPRMIISHNCLLIPVVVAFWWYWTKRKASHVVSRLFLTEHGHSDNNDVAFGNDEFSTWEDVEKQEANDTSVRLVRWIKQGNYNSSIRQRSRVKEVTRRTLQLASNPQFTQSIMERADESEEEECVRSPRSGRKWQCLKDVDIDDMELCAMPMSDIHSSVTITENYERLHS